MGAIISQNGRPVAYWSKKLSSTQKKYPTTDQELLAIVECLKQYKTMLFGQRITVWTDHKNLTFKNTEHASDRVLRQRLLLEEYGVDLKFIQGKKNEAADMLSRNEFNHEPCAEVDTTSSEAAMHELYANEFEVPIDYQTIFTYQRDDVELRSNRTKAATSHKYKQKDFGSFTLWNKKSDTDNKWRIWIPAELRDNLLTWYHEMLQHPGARRLEESVKANFTCPGLS